MLFSARHLYAALLASLSFSPVLEAATRADISGVATWLTSQKAHYTLALSTSAGHKTLSASGTMDYDVRETCTAWITHQKIDIERVSQQGKAEHIVSDYATTESKDGLRFVFQTQLYSDNALIQTISGKATLADKNSPGTVEYIKPLKQTQSLPAGTLFPLAHTTAILAATSETTKAFTLQLFDGTSQNGALYTFITTRGWEKPKETPLFSALKNMPYTQVSIAFYNQTNTSMLPDYTQQLHYFRNSVSDSFILDLGDFSMSSVLHTLSQPITHHLHC